MRLHRPNPLLFNVWMEECLKLLSSSPLLSDKKVVALLKLQRIADEANTAFGFDDPSTSFRLSELRLQAILRVFDKRMQTWRDWVGDDVLDSMQNHSNHGKSGADLHSQHSFWGHFTKTQCQCGSSPWMVENTMHLITTTAILRSRLWMEAAFNQRPSCRAPLCRLTAL